MASLRILLAAVPIAALTVAVPFVNRIEPRVLGLPFLLFWLTAWVVLTPVFLWGIGRVEKRW
jgi:Protein of unknown function (DUF3311)